MTKSTLLAIFTVTVLLIGTMTGSIGFIQSVDALKSKGTPTGNINSKEVCGDRLCSEIPTEKKPVEEKKKEQVKSEKKTKSAEKAKDVTNKDKKSETMKAAEKISSLKVPKTVTGVLTSVQDPGQGHESHQLAIILPPSENTYRGHLTFSATENIQLVALHGPLKAGMAKDQAIWSADGKTKFGLTFVDKGTSSGVWQFSGNAIAVHTKNPEPFTVSYSVTYTEHLADGEKVYRATATSEPAIDPGHDGHQTLVLLGPRDKPYSGHLTYDASEPVIVMTMIGPVHKNAINELSTWSPDGITHYVLVKIPSKAAGSIMFSGNALALHTQNSDPFTVSYSLVLTNPSK